MFMPDSVHSHRHGLVIIITLLLVSGVCLADEVKPGPGSFGFGRDLTAAELANIPPTVFPDGSGLPDGSGDAVTGDAIFQQQCAGCHGSQGEGGRAVELVGDRTLLASQYPDKGVAVYWPFATTLFNYIQRAMPPDQPFSLSVDDTYSVIAKVLELNGLLDANTTVTPQTLANIEMPNRNGFVDLH